MGPRASRNAGEPRSCHKMLSLSKRIDYALIALTYLAEEDGRAAPAQIAEANDLPQPLLMNLMKELHQHGLVRSTRGARGGYQLSIDPDRVSLYDLVLVIEGPIRLVECVSMDGPTPSESDASFLGLIHQDGDECRLSGHCTVRGPISALHHRLVKLLGDLRLSEIICPERRESALN